MCYTNSRARERQPGPKPLRSAEFRRVPFPLGLIKTTFDYALAFQYWEGDVQGEIQVTVGTGTIKTRFFWPVFKNGMT